MSDTQFYLLMGGGICLAFAIAWAIVSIAERHRCNRTEGSYACKGDNCEGCYRLVGGRVVYDNPQPANSWGEAPLTNWNGTKYGDQ